MGVKITKRGTRGVNLKRKVKAIQLDKGVKGYKVGWPVGATYDDGTPIADVALYNEFGTINIPERPFFRRANSSFSKDASQKIKALAVNGRINQTGNKILGLIHVNKVKESIRQLRTPPNAPSTVAMKSSSNPLIDTGLMRRSVIHEPLK